MQPTDHISSAFGNVSKLKLRRVTRLRVLLWVEQNLGGAIPSCGHILSHDVLRNARKSKVTDFELAALIHENISRFEVTMNNINTMKKVYAKLGGAVVVKALQFSEEELDAQAFLSMMAIGQSDHVPLYMQTVLVRVS